MRAADPCLLPKARKNAAEIKGARAAHKRDGASVVRFLAWLDRESPAGALDEISTSRRLETIRGETQALKEISFDTISGAGPNGAIVHYRVTTATNRKLKPGELYLVDSGAQYLDGTTDITRTVAIGKPTREMQERFTLVLKGHIAIATARFPKGTRGIDLDPFARRALWEAGLDYRPRHRPRHRQLPLRARGAAEHLQARHDPLEPGMIISNEPGYYKAGAYGIRIENLVLVTEPEKPAGCDRRPWRSKRSRLRPSIGGWCCPSCCLPPSSTGSTPITPACATSSARSSALSTARGWRRRPRRLTEHTGIAGKMPVGPAIAGAPMLLKAGASSQHHEDRSRS